MATEMGQLKATANAHMKREMQNGGKWVCVCEACTGIRSLIGVDKILGIRPLIRSVETMADQLDSLPEGAERQAVLKQYNDLQDQLAEEMAKP